MHGKELVVGVCGHKVRLRRQQLKPYEPCKRASDKEEKRNRDQIEDRNSLMVPGKQPAEQPVLVVEIGPLRQRCCPLIGQIEDCMCCTHGVTTPGVVCAAWFDSDVVSVCCTR